MKRYLQWASLFMGIYLALNLVWIGGTRYHAQDQFHQKSGLFLRQMSDELEKGLLGAGLSLLYKRKQPNVSDMMGDHTLLFHGEQSVYQLPHFEGFLNEEQTSLNFKIDPGDFHFPKLPDTVQAFIVAFSLKEMEDRDKAFQQHLRSFPMKHVVRQTLSVPNLMLVIAFNPNSFLKDLQAHGAQLMLTALCLIFVMVFFFFSLSRKDQMIALEREDLENTRRSRKRLQDSLSQLRTYQREVVVHFADITTTIKELSSILINNEKNLTDAQKTGFLHQLNRISAKIPKRIEDHEKQHINGSELLHQVKELLYADLQAKQVVLKLDVDDTLNLYGSRFFLKTLLLNLFSNTSFAPEVRDFG